jgi:hypothetical protein
MGALPDVCTELKDGTVVLIANKKARRLLSEGFEKAPPLPSALDVRGSR